MQVIDLTQVMETGMPVFPGSEQATLLPTSHILSAGYNELHLHFSNHTGTHIDCGKHLFEEGFDTGTASPESFYGKGLVIDCRELRSNDMITLGFLQSFESKLKQAEFIIFHTGWSRFWGTPDYFNGFPVPNTEAAHYLAGFSLKGTGIDAISFDPITSHDLHVHKILLSYGIVLIENLTNLDSLPETGFLFSCFPLKIKNGDGSPVRAVGILGNSNP